MLRADFEPVESETESQAGCNAIHAGRSSSDKRARCGRGLAKDPASGSLDLPSRFIRMLKKSLLNDLHVENDAALLAMLEASVKGLPMRLEHLVRVRRAGHYEAIERAKDEGEVIVFARPREGGGRPTAQA